MYTLTDQRFSYSSDDDDCTFSCRNTNYSGQGAFYPVNPFMQTCRRRQVYPLAFNRHSIRFGRSHFKPLAHYGTLSAGSSRKREKTPWSNYYQYKLREPTEEEKVLGQAWTRWRRDSEAKAAAQGRLQNYATRGAFRENLKSSEFQPIEGASDTKRSSTDRCESSRTRTTVSSNSEPKKDTFDKHVVEIMGLME